MGSIGLADAIENLREELTTAINRGVGQELRFKLDTIELELAVEIAKEGGVGGKVSFKVLGVGGEAGGGGKLSEDNVHRIKLILKPADGSRLVGDSVTKRPE